MKSDILIKLIKLANNNPNDHEANLAARKACKAIEENGFRLDEKVQPKVQSASNPTHNNNPSWYSSKYTEGWTGFSGSYTNYGPDGKRKPKPKQQRECVKCKKVVETVNINNIFTCNTCQWTEYADKYYP